jgi:hypothetical protein
MLKDRNWFIIYETILINPFNVDSVFGDGRNIMWKNIAEQRKKQNYDNFIRTFSKKALDKLP